MDRSSAIIQAIDDCIRGDVLKSFLERHASEVRNMLFGKWDWDIAKEVWQEEAREDGVAFGMEKVFSLLESGMSLAEAKKTLNLKKKKKQALGLPL
jgi:hypothetical protein